MSIRAWSTTPASNNAAVPYGAPENWKGSDVNNWGRQAMADIRDTFEAAQFFDYGHSVSYVSAGALKVNGINVTAIYETGRRVKALVGAGAITGDVVSATFAGGDTAVVLIWDSGGLDASLTKVAVGILSVTGHGFPKPLIALSGGDHSASSLAVAHLVAGAASISGLVAPGATLGSPTISGGTLGSPTISGGTISSPTINSPTISGGTQASPTIGSPTISGGTLGSPTISAGVLKASTLSTPAIHGGTLSAPAIQGGTLGSPALSTPTIGSPTISGGSIQAPTIGSPTISGGTQASPTVSTPTIGSPTISGGTLGSPTLSTPTLNSPVLNAASFSGSAVMAYLKAGTISASAINVGTLSWAGAASGALQVVAGARVRMDDPPSAIWSQNMTVTYNSLSAASAYWTANVSAGLLSASAYMVQVTPDPGGGALDTIILAARNLSAGGFQVYARQKADTSTAGFTLVNAGDHIIVNFAVLR